MIERREFITAGAAVVGATALAACAGSPTVAATGASSADWGNLKGDFLDLTTPRGNREAYARLMGNTDMESTKFGWYTGLVMGVRPGEAVRDLFGFTGMSTAKFLPTLEGQDPGYRKVLREVGYYTDLKSGEIIEEWTNPYLNEVVPVQPIYNDPFNHTITDFYPQPPSYGGLNANDKREKRPFILPFTRRGDVLNLYSHINLFYPTALPPSKWPRESGSPFSQVSENFLFHINWADMQDPKKTSVEFGGTWSRITPWLPWMLMGPTEGHCLYQCFQGAYDDIEKIDRKVLDYTEKHFPLYLTAPDTWEEPSFSSIEHYANRRQPAPLPADGSVPFAPPPELPAWYQQMMKAQGKG